MLPIDMALKAVMSGREGFPEDEPRPLAEFSHEELEALFLNPGALSPEGRRALERELGLRVEESPVFPTEPYDAAGGAGLAELDYTQFQPEWQDIHMSEPMDLAWRMLKAPVYPPGGYGHVEPDERFGLAGMKDMDIPEQSHAFVSDDGRARGAAMNVMMPALEEGLDPYYALHSLEHTGPRGEGLGRQYLQEMIEGLPGRLGALGSRPASVRAVGVQDEARPFWNRMVEEGLIESAHAGPRALAGERLVADPGAGLRDEILQDLEEFRSG